MRKRPCILTVRLMLVGLVVGVVLAVASVPVAALACEVGWPTDPTPTEPRMLRVEGHVLIMTCYKHALADYWTSSSNPVESGAIAVRYAILDGGWWLVGER